MQVFKTVDFYYNNRLIIKSIVGNISIVSIGLFAVYMINFWPENYNEFNPRMLFFHHHPLIFTVVGIILIIHYSSISYRRFRLIGSAIRVGEEGIEEPSLFSKSVSWDLIQKITTADNPSNSFPLYFKLLKPIKMISFEFICNRSVYIPNMKYIPERDIFVDTVIQIAKEKKIPIESMNHLRLNKLSSTKN